MDNPNTRSNYSHRLYKKIGYFLTIIVTEVIIFYMFINFLSSEGIDYRLFLLILPIIAFFVLQRYQKITNFVKEAHSQCNSFSIIFMILLLVSIPFLFKGNSYLLHICIMCGLYLIMALGLNIQLGSTGMVNFAFAAFLV